MRRTLPALLLLLLLPLLPALAYAEEYEVKVVNVVDGDTLTVLLRGAAVTLHLRGVDCPDQGQPFSRQAKQFTARVARGQSVTLRQLGSDARGLLTAEVILPTGESLNEELLRAGLGWWFEQESDTTWGFLEEEARLSGRGLWAEGAVLPPWEWRERQGQESHGRKR